MPLGGLIPYDGSPYSITIKAGEGGRGRSSGPQAPTSGSAGGIAPMRPPGGGGAMRSPLPIYPGGPDGPSLGIGLPAPPIMGPPVGGSPYGGPPVFGGPVTPPVALPMPFPGAPPPPGAGPPQMPGQVDWLSLLPLLLQMRMGGADRGAFNRQQ